MELIIMRHGQTPGNAEKRYVGALDQPLSEAGRQQATDAGVCPHIERVYVSPLMRARETASICFPCAQQIVVQGIQEMDFGVFTGRTPDEMADDVQYRAWIDSMCEDPCPQGESKDQVTQRICQAIEELVCRVWAQGSDSSSDSDSEQRIIVVAHGGTLMSVFSTFCCDASSRSYYEWNIGNCKGWRALVDFDDAGALILRDATPFSDLGFLQDA